MRPAMFAFLRVIDGLKCNFLKTTLYFRERKIVKEKRGQELIFRFAFPFLLTPILDSRLITFQWWMVKHVVKAKWFI